jgi:hypothetical protein
LPDAQSAPAPFFDALGRLNVVYVTTAGHVVLATYEPSRALGGLGRAGQLAHREWAIDDLTTQTVTTTLPTGVIATGQASAVADGANDLVAVRTASGDLVVMTVSDVRPFPVSTTVTLTSNDTTAPVLLGPGAGGPAVATTTATGHLDLFRYASATWTSSDLTSLTATAALSGAVAGTSNASHLYLTGLVANTGAVELFTGTVDGASETWTTTNVTADTASTTTPGPALGGTVAIVITGTTLSIAGRAAGWGDLFDFAGAGSTWSATDVSATGGSAAKTIGNAVAAVDPSGTVAFYAGGVNTPAPTGVGIYDIPSADLSHAISDGWPILADTGGLGTQTSPWVDTTSFAVNQSPDFTIGSTIQASHKRETWLSFWTVSGPTGTETDTPSNFEAHGFAAGAAVARYIDKYAAAGVGIKPDWVILDPEGYPDNHSQLDGFDVKSIVGNGATLTVTTTSPTDLTSAMRVNVVDTGVGALNIANAPITVINATTFTIPNTTKINLGAVGARIVQKALLVSDWSNLLSGWSAGLASVDSSLNAGIYADEYEYTLADLTTTPVPVFMAIAWAPNGASPVPITHGANVLGYIEFGNVCESGEVQSQLDMFQSAPWNGRYNTVQFTPPGYCTPTTP